MPIKEDLQWWAGALSTMVTALVLAVSLPPPYDKWSMGAAMALSAFAMYKVTPNKPDK